MAILENVWEQKPLLYNQDEIAEARTVLAGLLPSIKTSYAKAKEGGPQRTLLNRRIKSLEIAIKAIDVLQK